MTLKVLRTALAACTAVAAAAGLLAPVAAAAPVSDPFYSYQGGSLESEDPGTVLKTRTLPYHVANVATPIEATQLLYRSNDALGRPVANVTSVLRPSNALPGKVVAYASFYDSLNPEDGPSRAVAGDTPIGTLTPSGRNVTFGGLANAQEPLLYGPLLAQGYTVVIPDTQGPQADFGAGPEYGKMTLDALRAARRSPKTGISMADQIALMGYSGGAIATNLAAALAPSYAPEINAKLIGVAEGGLLANPANNLRYASGSLGWSGVVGMAIVGLARAYDIDFSRYMSARAADIVDHISDASIANVFAQYPGLAWSDLVKPQYLNPNSIPEFVDVANKINLGTAPVPTVPMFIGQAANGILEGTQPGGPGVGPGDGVMVAGDVRSLARRYCEAGLDIKYDQYDWASHTPGGAIWLPGALLWLNDRFNNQPAPNNCATIAPGNSLAPLQHAQS